MARSCGIARSHRHPGAAALALLLILCASSAAGYSVRFRGVSEPEIENALRRASQTYQLRGQDPPTEAILQRRIQNDLPRLRDALRAAAYYQATVEPQISARRDRTRITFYIREGKPYRFEEIEVQVVEIDGPLGVTLPLASRLKPGERARTRAILQEEQRLLRLLKSNGHPYARVARRRVLVNHDTEQVSVLWELDPGRALRFGETNFEGLDRLRLSAARQVIPWKEGDRFDIRKVETYETAALRSGLFSTAQIEIEPGDQDRVDTHIRVTERKPRSIRLGVRYRSDTGPGATTAWEHRNLFRGAEQFGVTLDIDEIERGADASFRRPGVFGPTRRLLLDTRLAKETPRAYESTYSDSSIAIEQQVSRSLVARAGAGFRYSDLVEPRRQNTYGLVYFPVQFDWNRSGDILDPRQGFRLIGRATPFVDTLGEDIAWFMTYLEFRPYVRIWNRPETLLALRGVVGNIQGQSRNSIPADERFYAGGGGSIRGFDYQRAGELSADGTPLGGTSLLEGSVELRTRLSPSWGGVLFLDGGSTYERDAPQLDEQFFRGAGVGLRYHTALGPFRADLAFPLNPRKDVDSSFEFYISFGQAF